MSSSDDAVLLRLLQAGAAACQHEGHVACRAPLDGYRPTPPCERLVEMHFAASALRREAEAFDAGQLLLQMGRREPDSSWSTAALLRLIHDQILLGPWERPQPLRRGILVTSALARLAERGLPPDAVVRVGLGDKLVRRLSAFTAISLHAELAGADGRLPLPGMAGWGQLLRESGDALESGRAPTGSAEIVLMARAAQGGFAGDVADWLGRASVRDLIAWNLEMTPCPDLHEEDLTLRGGRDAVRWICDRFVSTGLDGWARSSLEWELTFSQDPERTARRAGVTIALLGERSVLVETLVTELTNRHARPGSRDVLALGMTRLDVHELVVSLLSDERCGAAVGLLRAAVSERPDDDELRNDLAFALTAHDPAEAVDQLGRVTPSRVLSPLLIGANRAAAAIRCGDEAKARAELAELRAGGGSAPQSFILWTPEALLERERPLHELAATSVPVWAGSVLDLLDRRSPMSEAR